MIDIGPNLSGLLENIFAFSGFCVIVYFIWKIHQ